MKISTQKLKDSEIKLTVEVEENELAEYIKKAEKILSGQLKIRGFRTGKVPSNMAREKIGENNIKEEALRIATGESFSKAIDQEKLDVVETISMKIIKNEPALLKYETVLLVIPEIILGNYKNIEIKKNDISVTDKEISNTLAYLQKAKAQYKDTDLPAQKGDRVEVDFEISIDKKIIDSGKSENHPINLGNSSFLPGFEDQLMGMKIAEEKEFYLVVPNDYYQKSISGKKLECKVKMKKVQRVILAELNDDFAKIIGNFPDMETLKKSLSEGIKMEKEEKEKEKIKTEILEKISNTSKVDAPKRLVERQLDLMIKSFDENLHQKGMELGLYLAQVKKTQEDLRKDWHDRAVKNVKIALILKEIGKKEKIEIDEREVLSAANVILSNFGSVEEAEKHVDLSSLKDKIRSNLLNEKTMNLLEESAIIKQTKSP